MLRCRWCKMNSYWDIYDWSPNLKDVSITINNNNIINIFYDASDDSEIPKTAENIQDRIDNIILNNDC